MDLGHLNLFLKMLKADYALSESQLSILTNRMLADSHEFDRVWKLYKNKTKSMKGGDSFIPILNELLN